MDDRKLSYGFIVKGLWENSLGDRGYISSDLFKLLLKKGVKLITNIKLNMENKLIPLFDKLMLKKRSVVEVSDWSVKRRVSS